MRSVLLISVVWKVIFVLGLLLLSLHLYDSEDHWIFFSGVNLIFHEAGHVLMMFFGRTLYLLGGTFLELLVPLVVTLHFYGRRQEFAVGFGLWWLSTVFFGVGIYVSDARERMLPLITGDPNSHDWWQLLGEWGMLRYDDLIGGVFMGLSFLTLLAALVVFCHHLWNIYTRWSEYETLKRV